MNRVRFVEPARFVVLAEVDDYHRVNAGLGTKFLEAVEDATARTLAYPLAGFPAQHRPRRVFMRDFPFALVYRLFEQESQSMHCLDIDRRYGKVKARCAALPTTERRHLVYVIESGARIPPASGGSRPATAPGRPAEACHPANNAL